MNKSRGFTLIELLVTIAIIGILTTIAVFAVSKARTSARINKAKGDIQQIYTAIKILENDTGEWPGHQEVDAVCSGCSNNEICGPDIDNGNSCGSQTLDSGYAGLTQNDSGTPYSNWDGPYMVNIPLDPWGQQYFFDTDYNHSEYGECVIIGSYGPNGLGKNVYDSDDIVKKID